MINKITIEIRYEFCNIYSSQTIFESTLLTIIGKHVAFREKCEALAKSKKRTRRGKSAAQRVRSWLLLVPNSTKSQVFKIPLYLLNGRHYLVKLKAWREFWEAAGLKDRRCRPFLLKIRAKKNCGKSLRCSYGRKK